MSEIYLLCEQVSYFELTMESFINDDDEVKFYTGIHSYDALVLIFNNIKLTLVAL
jgi:predicted Co/Zn/Cd cation transporter (cation efflux family)